MDRFFVVDKGGEVFKDGIGAFTASDYQKSESVGVEFELLANFFLVVFFFKLVTNKPARDNDFFGRNAMRETGFKGVGVKDKIVSSRREFNGGKSARISHGVEKGKFVGGLMLLKKVVV